MADLPPCGIYRTSLPLVDHVPAGRLVFFHNHGDSGPGIYLPSGWVANRARWHEHGHPIPSPAWAASLIPLVAEGFYRVREPFVCCEKRCRLYEADLLVQLGYDSGAQPLLFIPEWTDAGLANPEIGLRVDEDRLARLAPPKVVATPHEGSAPRVR